MGRGNISDCCGLRPSFTPIYMLEILTPSTSEWDGVWIWVFKDVVKHMGFNTI